MNPLSDQARDQDVDDRFELLQFFDMSELGHEADFLLDLIPISVISPEEDVKGDSHRLPHELNRVILEIRGSCRVRTSSTVLLNRSQSNIQESNG